MEEGENKKEKEAVLGLSENRVSAEIIAKSLKISIERVAEIIKNSSE